MLGNLVLIHGQTILSSFPEDLNQVVGLFLEKQTKGEFVFCDSFSEWEDARILSAH